MYAPPFGVVKMLQYSIFLFFILELLSNKLLKLDNYYYSAYYYLNDSD